MCPVVPLCALLPFSLTTQCEAGSEGGLRGSTRLVEKSSNRRRSRSLTCTTLSARRLSSHVRSPLR